MGLPKKAEIDKRWQGIAQISSDLSSDIIGVKSSLLYEVRVHHPYSWKITHDTM